jgi:hypothetical protein
VQVYQHRQTLVLSEWEKRPRIPRKAALRWLQLFHVRPINRWHWGGRLLANVVDLLYIRRTYHKHHRVLLTHAMQDCYQRKAETDSTWQPIHRTLAFKRYHHRRPGVRNLKTLQNWKARLTCRSNDF